MGKDKLSPSELQLLLDHYQKKLKKAEKKLIVSEKRVEKLRKKVSKVLFLKQTKADEKMLDIFSGLVTEPFAEALEADNKNESAALPEISISQKSEAGNQHAEVSKPAPKKRGPKPKVRPEISSDKDLTPVNKETKKDGTNATLEAESNEKDVLEKRGRKKLADVEKARQEALAKGIVRPISILDWNNYVLELLAKNKRPLLTREIIAAAKEDLSYQDEEMATLERSIAKTVFTLSTKSDELKKYKGENKMRGYYYCLPKWYYPDGELKKMYLNRIPKEEEQN